MAKFMVVQEISFEVEADSKFEALEQAGENMMELINSKQFCVDGASYAMELPGQNKGVSNGRTGKSRDY